MYQSPIEIITKKMQTQLEDDVFKAIQAYGIVVDKEELIKALQYDRDQYEKGYADGMLAQKDEWISVEERLPDTQQEVLTYSECNGVRSACLIGAKDDIKMWYLYKSDKLSISVTHWMPLPEAPKMEGGDE